MKSIRQQISQLISDIAPFDEAEKQTMDDALNWIASGAQIFRIQKPAIPPKHLVVYSLLVDPLQQKIILFDHKLSGLLLPCGGHIDQDELPYLAAKRELKEELNMDLPMLQTDFQVPFFISQMLTVGSVTPHTDVSLWYLFRTDANSPIDQNAADFKKEFNGYQWYGFDQILAMDNQLFCHGFKTAVRKLMDISN